MAEDFLDWGSIGYGEVKTGRYPVDKGGRRLFLIKNGEPEFPEEDYRKWIPVGGGISAIGRLNTNTITFVIGLQRPFVSADDHKLQAIVTIRVKIGDGRSAWEEAVKAHADLEPTIRSAVERCAFETFKLHRYRDIFHASPVVTTAFDGSLAQEISAGTPYRLIGSSFEVEALIGSVDTAIDAAQSEIANEEERARTERIESDSVERDRAMERAQFEHEDDLAKRRGKAKREEEAEDARQRIQLEEEAQNARIRVMKATAEAVPDIEMLIALTDPKAAAEIQKAAIAKNAELSRAQGFVEAIKGALHLQDLNPVMDTTVRIVHETAKDPQEGSAQDPPE